jgi:Ca-activated chloride channel family protein
MLIRRAAAFSFVLLCVTAGLSAQESEIKKDAPASSALTVGFVIDCSGSQRLQIDHTIALVKQISEGLSESDQAFLVRFVDAAKISVMQELTSSKTDIQDTAEGLYVEGGLTAITDGMDAAGRYMSRNLPDGSKPIIILISDGDDRGSGRKVEDVISALKQKQVRVFTVGISDLKVSMRLLDRFAKETGGKSYTPRNAAELSNTAVDISKAIRGGISSK